MKLFGNKDFYKNALKIAVPIIVQNGVSNFVNLLDNIMVGRTGTESMTGVSIANQLIFVFTLSIFGAVSGASIFGAQFYGKRDYEGVRHTLRYRVIIGAVLTALFAAVFIFKGDFLLGRYLMSEESQGDVVLTLAEGKAYLAVMLLGLLPQALTMAYASALRDTGETFFPMLASLFAVFTNLVLNYILIFGKLGAPALGVTGAAIATVVSRFVEFGIILIRTHLQTERYPFAKGLYRGFTIPGALMRDMLKKGLPLLVNEFLWSVAMAVIMQCYSLRGLEVVAALNISSTISNLFNVVYMAFGTAIGIMVGPLLGAGEMEEARTTAVRMLTLSVLVSVAVGAIMAAVGTVFPNMYNTSDYVRSMAVRFIAIVSCCMPIFAYNHAAYFIVRTGGKTVITFFFDSMFECVLPIPLAYCLSRFTGMSIYQLYICVQLTGLVKVAVGTTLIVKGIWMNNLVDRETKIQA